MAQTIIQDDIDDDEIERDQYLVFNVKAQEFGIQAMRVQEISAVFDVTEVPNSPLYIEGIMNLRGQLMTVIDFRKKFGFEPKEHDEDTRVIVVEMGSFPIGIIVDAVEEVVKIPEELVQQLPESTTTAQSKEYMTGIGMLDKRIVILLDTDKVLTGTELIEVGAISKAIDETQTAEKTEQESDDAPASETPRGTESNKADTEQPANTVKQTKRRTG